MRSDERSSTAKVHLTRWSPTAGWWLDSSVLLGDDVAIEYAAHTPAGWLLLGACHEGADGARLDALVLVPGAKNVERRTIPLARSWDH